MVKQGQVVSEQELDHLSGLFRLLADRTRLNILMRLCEGERNVTTLCDELKLPQPTVSHHLALLRMSNVVGNRRSGKQVFYALNGSTRLDTESLQFGVENFVVRLARVPAG